MKKIVPYLLGIKAFPHTKSGKCVEFLWSAWIVLASTLVVGVLSLYFGAVKYGMPMFRSYFGIRGLVLLNLLPVVLLAFFLWFLLGRPVYGIGLTTILVMTLTVINVLKIRLRNDPLLFEDVKLATEAGNIAGKYNLSLTAGMWKGIIIAIAVVLLSFLLTRRCHMGFKKGWLKIRLLCIFATAGMMAVVWNCVYLNKAVYEKTISNFGINHYSGVDEFQSRGFVYPFLYSYLNSVDRPPEGYHKKEAAAVLAEYEDADIPADKKVNVIAVMLEAYADLSKLVDNEVIDELYEPLHTIEENSISGGLVANVFAGGTCDTERCYVTGYSRLGGFRSMTNSYMWYLASQGYTVEGSHPGYNWFYNRENVNQNLGFSKYYFYDDHYRDIGMKNETLIQDSDALFFPELYKLMEQSMEENGQPYFSFNVSYQNHGPYSSNELIRAGEVYLTPEATGWSEETCMILNNYLGGVKDTTEQMQKLLDTMEQAKEPVVFVAFGDHLPWLGDNSSVYKETGMDIFSETTQGYLNQYTTPYFIWANSAAKEVLDNDFRGEGETVSPNFLMNEVFDALGWQGDAYMQYTQTVKEVCPIITANGYYGIDGEIVQTLSDEDKAIIDQFGKVQYYRRKNYEEYK